MAVETMLLDQKLSAEAHIHLIGTNPRGDPKSITDEGTEGASCRGRTRNLGHQLAAFFKIGHGYDWEEQYREYSEHWRNYFQAPPLA